MKKQSLATAVAILVALLTAACGAAPGAGSGASVTPTTSPAQSASPTPTAVTQPTAAPSSAPEVAYLDDRSSPEQVIRSYYDAIGRRQYLRAYSYWEPSTTLPSYDVFAKGFDTTSAATVELGTVGGSPGAGQLYWSVPAVVLSTTTTPSQSFVGCYTVHLARPEIQTAPPFKPMAIQSAQLQPAASAAAARSAMPTACGSANATPLPWGAAGTGIDAARYIDDRSAGEQLVRSYYNAVNRQEYSRAYAYWEAGAPQLSPFASFSSGYANTKSVMLLTKAGTIGAGAGQTYYTVPSVITASNADGSTAIFSGCYTLHLGSPNAQATPPFQPLGIQSAKITQAASGANASDLLNTACP
jgi:predicted small secreted protein